VEGLLCLLVSYQAHREIVAAAGNGEQAIGEVIAANEAIDQATRALSGIHQDSVVLSGPGTQYVDSYTSATKQLTLAALHNVAGPASATSITFAGVLLVTYDGQARQAITDYVEGHDTLGAIEVGYLPNLGVQYTLTELLQKEQQAATADLSAWWLRPGYFWSLLLAPFLAVLFAAAGTSYLLWRGFRRLLSGYLTIAVALTLALVVLVGALNTDNGWRAKTFMAPMLRATLGTATGQVSSLSADAAYSSWVLLVGALLVAGASVLVYLAYRPRLEEYAYRPRLGDRGSRS